MSITCTRCIFDDRIPEIVFDDDGVCNYCHMHDEMNKEYPTGPEGEKILMQLAEKIRRSGKRKKYDCAVGVSGGCDSSFLLYKAKELGLRPLAVHFDNTWNNKIAVRNIHNVLKALEVDLYTYVVDNEEFNDLCRAFLKASVPEVDAATDIALQVTIFRAAAEHGIKYLFNGHSFRTEGIGPAGWFYFDGKYIESVHKEFGTRSIDSFPHWHLSTWMKWLLIDRFIRVRPLYNIDYDKNKTREFLENEFGWQWYGGHHMENKWTIFCDNYYMPTKFDIDLRYVEYSAFIRMDQMTRAEALKEISQPPPVDEGLIPEIKERLKLSDGEFDEIMNAPLKRAGNYKTYRSTFKRMRPFFWLMYKASLVPKSFYVKYTK